MTKKDLLTNRVNCNLIQQDCYVRDCMARRDIDTSTFPAKYVSLDEKVTPGGVEQVFSEYDYPITSDYVNSFVDSCDYKLDPLQAMAKSSSGVNLGDISYLQNLSNLDMEAARDIYMRLNEKFASLKSSESKEEKNKSEVKENEK